MIKKQQNSNKKVAIKTPFVYDKIVIRKIGFFATLVFIFTLTLLQGTPKALAATCPTASEINDTGTCPVCPPHWVYSSNSNNSVGGCVAVEPPDNQSSVTERRDNCINVINCSTLGADYSCSQTLNHVPSNSSTFANGCCNGTKCAIDSSGKPPPTPPPTEGGSCNPGLVNGVDMGGCSGNNQLNPACSQNELCSDSTGVCGKLANGSYSGKCIANTTGTCITDANCGSGYTCNNGTCILQTPPPTISSSLLPPPCAKADADKNNGNCSIIQTALGNINTGVPGFIKWLITLILSVAGSIVLLIIIATGYRLMASQGDPEKVKEAREGLTAAIVGLLFIIFSLVILQFITISVLHIPAFH